MEGIGVINGAADFSRSQVLLKSVAPLAANRVLVEDVLPAFGFVRRHNTRNLFEQTCVFRGVRTPRALPLRKVAELYAQNRSLDFVQAAVPTWLAAQVFRGLAVIAQRAETLGKFRRVRNHHPRVAASPKIFCRVEAQACGITERAGAPSFVGRADGLRAVFN